MDAFEGEGGWACWAEKPFCRTVLCRRPLRLVCFLWELWLGPARAVGCCAVLPCLLAWADQAALPHPRRHQTETSICLPRLAGRTVYTLNSQGLIALQVRRRLQQPSLLPALLSPLVSVVRVAASVVCCIFIVRYRSQRLLLLLVV